MRSLGLLLVFTFLHTAVWARLGDTEAELKHRFGVPAGISQHSITAQGKRITLGPTHRFRQGDWTISCDLIDGRCVRISYNKPGDWSEDQIKLVLNSNGQGASWTEDIKRSHPKLRRDWKRTDGSTATWSKIGVMSLTWDAYNKAKATAEEQARVAARKKPQI